MHVYKNKHYKIIKYRMLLCFLPFFSRIIIHFLSWLAGEEADNQ